MLQPAERVLWMIIVAWLFATGNGRAESSAEPAAAAPVERATEVREGDPGNLGSTYVPLDTWIYPAFARLAALGYAPSAIAGLRPWTRMECARLIREAGELMEQEEPQDTEVFRLYQALAQEFLQESRQLDGRGGWNAQVESLYLRDTGISGSPLTDGYHFGQTVVNDYGRPYAEGGNVIAGFSARAEAGPFAFYVRGEYQGAAALAAVPEAVRAAIAVNDVIPLLPAPVPSAINRFRLLDAYLALAFKGLEISVGKQSLWWGPGRSGPLLWSNNAEPVAMVRISKTFPVRLPGIFSWLGPLRSEFFFGKLEGHQFPPRPYVHGQKISFKPTPNLELGFSRTVIFAGRPQPLTWGTFFDSFVATSSGNPDPRYKPGDKRGAFDFSYRLPGLRNWVILYSDSLTDDDPSPLAAPPRAAVNPGIYLPRLPRLPKLDFRLEAVYTDAPTSRSLQGQFIYWEYIYKDAYTNRGVLLGNWVGREGKGIQAWSTYWASPRKSIQVGYRNAHVASDFLNGGRLHDLGIRADWLLRPECSLTAWLQYERSFLDNHSNGMKAHSVYEPRLLGSAGTLVANRNWIVGEREFWVVYADVLTTTNLAAMLGFHRQCGQVATLATYQVSDPQRCGILTVDAHGIVREFREKPDAPISNLAFAGLLVATPALLDTIPRSSPADLGYDVFPRLLGRMTAYRVNEYLIDIGTLENYRAAQSSWPGLACPQTADAERNPF